MEKIQIKYNEKLNTKSDINEHLPVLNAYARECDVIVEIGVRWIVSTWAFLSAKPKKLISMDINHPSFFGANIEEVYDLANEYNIDFSFRLENSLESTIEECDLLFIDTWHDYLQLKKELFRHSHKVSKYIILHDTETYGYKDEAIYENYNENRPETNLPKGLCPAIDEFLYTNRNWVLWERYARNNGITILKKMSV